MCQHTGPQIDPPGFRGMHGTPGRAAHLARMLMMVALLPRGLIGGLWEDPDAVSYPESTHASASVPQTACAQLYRLVSMLTASLDDFSLLGAHFGRPNGSGRWR